MALFPQLGLKLWKKKRQQVFRDPLYGYIHIDYDFITELIDTSVFKDLDVFANYQVFIWCFMLLNIPVFSFTRGFMNYPIASYKWMKLQNI